MKVKVGIAQMKCVEDKQQNVVRYTENVRELATQGAQIICLQELFASLYFCDEERYVNFQLAEPIPEGPTCQHFMTLAKELGVVLVCSLFEKRAEGLYHNTTAVIDADGTYLGKYRKMHIPDDPGYYEKFYFTPGDLGYKVFKTRFATLGVLICWDQWYPEAARLMALQGAELLIYPTAIGYDPNDTPEEQERQRMAWQTVQRGHAVANGLHVVTVNRVGDEDGVPFWGTSFVAGPQGELLYEASKDEEESIIVEIDLGRSEQVRRWWPFLRDRRIDEYEEITKRYID